MEPINITENLRINDFDDMQYTIERRSIRKKDGAEIWSPLDYCRSIKSLMRIAHQRLGDVSADAARMGAEKVFDDHLRASIEALPGKLPSETQ